MAYVVAATWRVKPGEEDAVADALGELAVLSRGEPGNLMYQVHRDPSDPNVFFMYEQYVDMAAFQIHATSAHFQRLCLEDAVPHLAQRSRAFYETWEPAAGAS